jgi:hypothetical protein
MSFSSQSATVCAVPQAGQTIVRVPWCPKRFNADFLPDDGKPVTAFDSECMEVHDLRTVIPFALFMQPE